MHARGSRPHTATWWLALGSRTHYLGIPGAREHALPFKTIAHALAVRNWILNRIERASAADSQAERRALLMFVIVGGGPTGVELAGALLVRQPLTREIIRTFVEVKIREVVVLLNTET